MINKEIVMMNGGFAIFTTEELINEVRRRAGLGPKPEPKSFLVTLLSVLLLCDSCEANLSLDDVSNLIVETSESGVPVTYTFSGETGELIDSYNPERDEGWDSPSGPGKD
jgi:hypothetical protein